MTSTMTHGGALAAAIRRYGGSAGEWLDLSTGINPLPVRLPPIADTLWQRLPDSDLDHAARSAAARFYGTGHTLPLAVPGTQSAIQHLPRLLGQSGAVAIRSPTYSEHEASFRRAGWRVDQVSDLASLSGAYRAAVVVNPNNPDGRVAGHQTLLEHSRTMREAGGWLIVDEAFADLDPRESLASVAALTEGLIVLRSFGKFFGLAGLRLGFVIANEGLLKRLQAEIGPWAVAGPALAIAARILGEEKTTEALRAAIHRRNVALKNIIAGAKLTIVGNGGLFLLVQTSDATQLFDHLARRRILVRAFDYRSDWLRFGLTADETADGRLAHALADFKRN